MNKAIAYIRVSTVKQVREGDSLAAQQERLEAYCKAHQLQLVEIIREEGISGTTPLARRPGGSRLLQMVGPECPHIVVMKFDRMFRNTLDALATIADLDARGVRLHALDFGGMPLDTSTALGKLIVTLRAGFAQMERDLTRERIVETMQYKKSRNQRIGHVPFGHTATGDQLVVHADFAKAIRFIFKAKAEGKSLRTIAEELPKEFRHPCFRASHVTVATILRSHPIA